MHTAQIDPRHALTVAARVGCDPRTARAWLAGRNVRGGVLRARLSDAVRELGLTPPSGG